MKNPTAPADAGALANALEAFRRRYRRVTFAANALTASIVVASAAVPLLVGAPIATSVRLTLLLTCTGFAVAFAAAMIRTPARRRIAAILDARLALDDRLVTALQFIDDHDVVSRLVVRDAAARIAEAAPARVFPYHVPPRLPAFASVAFAASASLTLIAARVPASLPGRQAGAGATTRPTFAAASGDTRAQAADSAPTPPANAPSMAQASDSGGPRAAEGPRTVQSAPGNGSEFQQGTGMAARGARSLETPRSPDGAPLPGADPQHTAATIAPPASSASHDSRPGVTSGAAPRAGSISSATGGVSGAGSRQRAGSGGAPRSEAAKPDVASAEYEARYRESLARVESALAPEHTPPGLRAYLREYFLSIGPR